MRQLLLLVVLAASVPSCSPAPLTSGSVYDSDLARRTLLTTLEAWKKGRVAELARRMPPIRFVDEDWSAGWQLLDYKLQESEAAIRPFQPVVVELKLRNRQGKIVQRAVSYQVTLHPRLAVLRAES